jgi:hypothetical protein
MRQGICATGPHRLLRSGLQWRRSAAAAALSSGLLLLTGYWFTAAPAAKADPRTLSACENWDEAARHALARLVHDRSDLAARQLGDSLFRLRRARRNCEAGWVTLACSDYRAIVASARVGDAEPRAAAPTCSVAAAGGGNDGIAERSSSNGAGTGR